LTFIEFFLRMVPATMSVLVCDLITCVLLEKLKWFGYGAELPRAVASVLAEYDKEQDAKRD
jgi:NhaB family Na+:H+ antiporter